MVFEGKPTSVWDTETGLKRPSLGGGKHRILPGVGETHLSLLRSLRSTFVVLTKDSSRGIKTLSSRTGCDSPGLQSSRRGGRARHADPRLLPSGPARTRPCPRSGERGRPDPVPPVSTTLPGTRDKGEADLGTTTFHRD